MEFGNLGNAYVAYGFFGLLRRWFPQARISTTLEFSSGFLARYSLTQLPKELWDSGPQWGLSDARADRISAERLGPHGFYEPSSSYLQAVIDADVVLDLSGDMWGDNANEIHAHRFETGLLRILTAQILGKKTALVASSPGPFSDEALNGLAGEVLRGYDLVLNRESKSTAVLETTFGPIVEARSRSCPSVEFITTVKEKIGINATPSMQPTIGFSICGWNLPGSYWRDTQIDPILLKELSTLVHNLAMFSGARMVLFSHANGFQLDSAKKTDLPGRDYELARQIFDDVKNSSKGLMVELEQQVLGPEKTIELISDFDLLISGRAHGCLAGLALGVPTVMVDYANGARAHKTRGFMDLFGQGDRIISLTDTRSANLILRDAYEQRREISGSLAEKLDFNLELIDRIGEEIWGLING